MKIEDNLLTKNAYSRPGTKIKQIKAIVIHWLANPWQSATSCRDYFEARKDGKNGYGSAHYIVGLSGTITRCIPDNEVAYHVGSSQIDPESGKVYTDLAREKFGMAAIDFKLRSPNECTIGIEHCHIDNMGLMQAATIDSSISLSASLCKQYGLDPLADILLHKEIVGWKDCHKYFVMHPEKWIEYKQSVSLRMEE